MPLFVLTEVGSGAIICVYLYNTHKGANKIVHAPDLKIAKKIAPHKEASMKKNIVRNASKLSVFLVLFLMLTLVFTLYQTSINAYVVDVIDELNITDVESNPNILQIMPVTAEAISSFTYHTFWSSKSMSNTWGSVVEKKETYTATTSLDSDAYKRAGYGNAIKFYAYYSVTSSGNGSQAFYVTASGGASSQNTLSMSNSSGTHSSSKYNLPGGTTTFTATLTMQTNGKAFTQQTATVTNCRVYLEKADTTSPTISTGSTNLSSAYWQTSNTVSISDTGAGINTVSVTYTNLAGANTSHSLNWNASGTSSSSRSTSRTLTLPGQGKYVITVTDNVGNSTSKTVWYYSSVINATVNNSAGGNAYVTTSDSSSGSATQLTGRFGTQSYYLYAAPKTGYYFTGWSGYSTLGVGSYIDNKWRQSQTIAAAPKDYEFNWQANFSEIVPLIKNNGTASPSGTTSFTFNYSGSSIPLSLSVPSGYAGSITYTGTSYGGVSYNSTTAPTYAGTYTAYVTLTSGGSTIGTGSYSVTINKINVYAKPTFPASAPNGAENSKVYDGNNVITQANATDWTLGSESASNSIITADKLQFTSPSSASFTYNNENVGTGKVITVNASASIASTKTNDANTNANIAGSYIFNNSGDVITGTITPKMLIISSAGYGQCYDGTTPISSLNGYYVGDAKITTDAMGKVYDGKTNAYFAGIIIQGYITGDEIGFSTEKGNNTGYQTKSNETKVGNDNRASILQSFSGTYGDQHAGTNKTITSTSLYLSGNDRKNYYVSGLANNNNSTSYNDQPITLYQGDCTIAQKDVRIAIESHSNKIYDGNDYATVDYKWVDPADGVTTVDPIQIQNNGTADNLYIDASKAEAKFSTSNANYYAGVKAPTNGRWYGNNITIQSTKLAIALGSKDDANVAGNTRLTNYRLVSTETLVYSGEIYSEQNYNNGLFIAITTKELELTLNSKGKVYDGNRTCYDYSWVSKECDCDAGKITISATVTYSDYEAKIVTATAKNITISSADGVHKNYHLKEDANGALPVDDQNTVSISPKEISTVIVDAIEDVYYGFYQSYTDTNQNGQYDEGEPFIDVNQDGIYNDAYSYAPTPAVKDNAVAGTEGRTTLQVGTDFSYDYSGSDFTTVTGTQPNGTVIQHLVVIKGTGNYTGEISTEAKILKARVAIGEISPVIITYGQSVTTANIKASSITNSDLSFAVNVVGGWAFDESEKLATSAVPVVADSGEVTIQFTPTDTWNYVIPDPCKLSLTVNLRPITIKAKAQTLEFGSNISFSNSDMTYSATDSINHTGLYGSDTFGELYCEVSKMVYALPGASLEEGKIICMVGEYAITDENENGEKTIANPNYDITFVPSVFSITKHKVTIKADQNTLTKIYGEADPTITYSITSGSTTHVTTSLIEGSLARTQGELQGNYNLNKGTIGTSEFNLNNYDITLAPSSFVISRRQVLVRPVDVIGHYFGETITISQTAFTASPVTEGDTTSGIAERDKSVSLATLLPLTIIRTRTGLSDSLNNDLANVVVGSYDLYILTTAYQANDNYEIITERALFTIIPRPVLVTPIATGREYDGIGMASDGDNALNYKVELNVEGLENTAGEVGYALVGKLVRKDGADVGNYLIQQGTLSNNVNGANPNPNYEISFSLNPVYYTIKPLEVNVTADPVLISVGDPLPDNSELTYSTYPEVLPTPLVGGLMILGNPEDVGLYDIVADDVLLQENKNYNITYEGANKLTIQKLVAVITPEAVQITFGEKVVFGSESGQLNINFSIKDNLKGHDLSHLLSGDDAEFSGSLSIDISSILPKNAGESEAEYHERKNEYLENNYLPAGKYKIAIGSFQAKLHESIKDGEPIQDTNYTISLSAEYFTINKKNVIVKVPTLKTDGTSNLTKPYDNTAGRPVDYFIEPSDVVPGYEIDSRSALTRTAGNKVGSYAIALGNFNSLANSANNNYLFSLEENLNNDNTEDKLFYFTITKREIVAVPVIPEGADKISHVYGNNDVTIGYTTYLKADPTQPGLLGNEKLGGALGRVGGRDVTEEGYEIIKGDLNDDKSTGYNANYKVELDTNGIRYYITRRDVTVTAVSIINERQAHVFGDAQDKTLTATYSAGGLVYGQTELVGDLEREPGITPGEYKITRGSITNENNPNYNVIFVEGKYKIYPREITLEALDGQKKGYTDPDPASFEYVIKTGFFVAGYEPSFELVRAKGETVGKYNFIFILEDNSACVNNSYYKFSQFSNNTNNAYGKRIFIDSVHQFSIDHGQAEFGFNDATIADAEGNLSLTLEYNGQPQTVDAYLIKGGDEEYVDANGNGQYDEGEEYVDINENGKHDKAVDVIYRINGKIGKTFKDAGTYNVQIQAVANDFFWGTSVNVTVTVKPMNLGTVNPADRLTENDLTKIYDDEDQSNFTFTIDTGYGDIITATMVREEGEDVGTYDLVSIAIDNTNYELVFEEGTNLDVYEILPREINVVPSAKSIAYGTELSVWDEVVTDDHGNQVTITFTRTDATNNNANTYDIASYVIDSTNHVVNINADDLLGRFVITKRIASVKAVAVIKVFDGTAIDLSSLAYEVTGMVDGEVPVGNLTIVAEGTLDLTNAGKYTIVAEGFDNASNPNYEMSFTPAVYEIQPASIIISPVAVSYEYGQVIAPFTYTIQSGSVFAGYPLEGSLGDATQTNVGSWEIPQGTLDNAEGRNPNYQIQYLTLDQDGNDIRYEITKRYIKIKVDSATKVYGDPMPALEYEFVDGTSLIDGDQLHGSLSATGTDVGTYEIIMSDEFKNDNPNYEVDLDSSEAIFTITARPVTVTPEVKTSVYGERTLALSYTTEGLIEGDTLEGELACDLGKDVGTYPITKGTLFNKNYVITVVEGVEYEITPRAITITINDAESEYGQVDATLTYSVTKGNVVGEDNLNVTLTRESGSAMGFYEISGVHNNSNYTVTFINGTYTIKKYKAVITVEAQYINFVEDGEARMISATCSSGAEITYAIDFETVHNFFKNAGKYVVVLNAPETESYYAPDPVTVYITINRPFIKSEANGIDIKLETENGFDPNMSIEMNKLPSDFEDIQAELKSNQKIVRAFTLTTTGDQDSTEMVPGKTTITIRVPSTLQEEKAVQVMVQEDGVYNLIEVDVVDGYVTLEVDSLSSFAFIQEESNNYLLIIIAGVAVLIMLGSVMVFLFRKRV